MILGVRDGEWYEPDISRNYSAFRGKEDDLFAGYSSYFGNGYYQYLWHTFCFDEDALQFIEMGEPKFE